MKRPNIDDVRMVAAETGHTDEEPATPNTDDNAEARIAQLAALSTIEYGLQRKAAAENLGIPVAWLDKAVKESYGHQRESKKKQGKPITFEEIHPADDPVNGGDLLTALIVLLKDYLVLPVGAAVTIGLFVLRTWVYDIFEVNPRLILMSPEMQCGKSTLLAILKGLLPKAQTTSNASTAAIFRIIEMYHPSLLIDEMDAMKHKETFEELRGILNSGHIRASANVIRTVGEDYEPRLFSTWCPMVYVAIGQLPNTLEDRSFIIRLQRKLPSESVKDWPITQGEELDALKTRMEGLRRQCARWAEDFQATLTSVKVRRVSELDDRANNNWSTLLTVAEGMGGEWPEKARQAAVLISGTHTNNETIGVQMLADIQEIFKSQGVDRISSQTLCDALEGMEERPWATWRKGKPMSQNNLARLLKPFEVSSKDIREKGKDNKVLRGYEEEQFLKAWARYCVSLSGTPVSRYDNATTPMNTAQPHAFQSAREESGSTFENGTFANTGEACSTVALQTRESHVEHKQVELLAPKEDVVDVDL